MNSVLQTAETRFIRGGAEARLFAQSKCARFGDHRPRLAMLELDSRPDEVLQHRAELFRLRGHAGRCGEHVVAVHGPTPDGRALLALENYVSECESGQRPVPQRKAACG